MGFGVDILDENCHMFCDDDVYNIRLGVDHAHASTVALWED